MKIGQFWTILELFLSPHYLLISRGNGVTSDINFREASWPDVTSLLLMYPGFLSLGNVMNITKSAKIYLPRHRDFCYLKAFAEEKWLDKHLALALQFLKPFGF